MRRPGGTWACCNLPWHGRLRMQLREELSRAQAHGALGDNLLPWPPVQWKGVGSPRSQAQWVGRQQKGAWGCGLHLQETLGLESCCHHFPAVVTSLNPSAPHFSHF